MTLGPGRLFLLMILRLTPKNLLSKLGGLYASIPWPGPLQRLQLRIFSAIFGINLAEARDPLSSFRNLNAFFTRYLVDGARPLDDAADALLSPCDGAWGSSGTVDNGQILQVKGRPYSLGELLGGEDEAKRFEGGAFCTLYLSPKDYHRFHAPLACHITRATYLPGALWPVNSIGVYGVDGLFAQNERIVAWFETDKGTMAYIPVGATMVGKVHLTFDDLTTNAGGDRLDRTYDPPKPLGRGEEVGRFEFGSTVVLVATPGLIDLDAKAPGTPLRMGTRIGSLG
jgi:phosphatidylserine decarboxylase